MGALDASLRSKDIIFDVMVADQVCMCWDPHCVGSKLGAMRYGLVPLEYGLGLARLVFVLSYDAVVHSTFFDQSLHDPRLRPPIAILSSPGIPKKSKGRFC